MLVAAVCVDITMVTVKSPNAKFRAEPIFLLSPVNLWLKLARSLLHTHNTHPHTRARKTI